MSDHYREDIRLIGQRVYRIRWFYDADSGPPWVDCDGHGPVSDWVSRDKNPGELVLCEDHKTRRYYDFAAAVRTARREGWGCGSTTGAERGRLAAEAARADFEYLRDWCNDRWYYCGIEVALLDPKHNVEEDTSVWAVEEGLPDSATHHNEIINDFAEELL